MPLYVYHCDRCGINDEKLRGIDEADDPTECPSCGELMRRLFSPFSFKFALPAHWKRRGLSQGHDERKEEFDAIAGR